MGRSRQGGPPPTSMRWAVTLADLLCLMLCFFVLLFAMSGVRLDDWRVMTEALTQRLNPERIAARAGPTADLAVPRSLQPRAIDLGYLHAVLAQAMAADPALAPAALSRFDDRLVLTLPGDLLFAPGSAEPTAAAAAAAAALAAVLRNVGNRVEVAGHTDPRPSRDERYSSNWELSLARAAALGEVLNRAGYPRRVAARGLADGRFYDLPPDAAGNRSYELARRVEVVMRAGSGGRDGDD